MLDLARRQHRSDLRRLCLLGVLLIVATTVSLCAGDRWLGPESWFTPEGQLFVWQIRLPRTLAVLLVGAALALCGTIMQALFENPLAEPGLLGVSNGAGVGLIAAVMLGGGELSGWGISLSAILGALLITLILLRFARRHLSTSRLLLAGVALGIICSALMTWAVYFSTSFDLRQLMYWMMGGFGGVDWRQGWLMVLLIPVILWTAFQAQPLNILALGETSARQLRDADWILAQRAGYRHWLDGRRKRGAGGGDWLYWAGDPAYAAPVRHYGPPNPAPGLGGCRGGNAAGCRYHRPARPDGR